MITRLLLQVKKYSLFLLLSYITLITILSFISIDDVEVVDEDVDDKIFHMLAYFVMVIICFIYISKVGIRNALVVSCILCFIYGIIIEVLQPIISINRVFDFYDIAANTIGIVFGCLFLLAIKTKLKSI